MTQTLVRVRAHLRAHFAEQGIDTEPDVASVTFLGAEPIEVLRFGPGGDGVAHFVSLGCSRHPMIDPARVVVDPQRGPRAEIILRLHTSGVRTRCARRGGSTASMCWIPIVAPSSVKASFGAGSCGTGSRTRRP